MKDDFTHLLRIRYSECDAQKVVFNGKYVEYIDIAVTEFMRSIWGNYNEILEMGIDNQVVSLNINWKSPAYFDEIIAIKIQTIHIGSTSYALQVNFVNHTNGAEIAKAEVTYVMVHAEEHTKLKIPDNLKSKLGIGAPGVISNHAGV